MMYKQRVENVVQKKDKKNIQKDNKYFKKLYKILFFNVLASEIFLIFLFSRIEFTKNIPHEHLIVKLSHFQIA